MLKVAIVDDHKLFGKSLALLLHTFGNIEVIFIAYSGKHFLELLQTKLPDLVLLDIQMPELDGIETCKLIRQSYAHIKILMITLFNDAKNVDDAMKAGANGFFCKTGDPEDLRAAIDGIFENTFYCTKISGLGNKHFFSSNAQAVKQHPKIPDAHFTKREIDIIRLVCSELSSGQIAYQLGINVRTVETYRKKIMVKTGSKNAVGVFSYALSKGLVAIK